MRGTERILEMKRKRTQLMKARLAAIALGLVSIVLALTVFVLSKELKQAKNTINNYQKIEAELNIENRDLQYDLEEAKNEIEELNSFDNKISVAFELEDIVREAVSGIEYVEGSIEYKVNDDYSITTDVNYVDYVLDDTTGETVRVLENNEQMIVTYINDNNTMATLEESISNEYNLGTERYVDVINSLEGALLVRHDYK